MKDFDIFSEQSFGMKCRFLKYARCGGVDVVHATGVESLHLVVVGIKSEHSLFGKLKAIHIDEPKVGGLRFRND